MKYNKSAIMKAAWAMHRDMVQMTRRWPEAMRKEKLANYFSTALKIAWSQAKAAAKSIAAEDRLFNLEMKDHWDRGDYEAAKELRSTVA